MAMTLSAFGPPVAVMVVPSSGSSAMSTSGSSAPPRPTFSPMKSMGASSRSPSPMTMVPRMCRSLKALRIASTAAWSASFSSPRPITRAEAIAAASVSRTASSPMFLSIPLALLTSSRAAAQLQPAALQLLQQPVRSAGRPQLRTHADVDRMAQGDHRAVLLAVHLVLESDLHPGMRLGEMHFEHVVVLRGLDVLHRCLEDRQKDASALDLPIGEPQAADEVAARSFEEPEVVGVVDDAHLVGVAVDDADAVGLHSASSITARRDRRPAADAFVPAADPWRRRCWSPAAPVRPSERTSTP